MENKISLTWAKQQRIWGKMEDMIPFTDIKIRIELDLSNQPTKITYITSLLIFPIVFGCLFRLRERRSYCPCCYTTWKSITFLFPSFIFFLSFKRTLESYQIWVQISDIIIQRLYLSKVFIFVGNRFLLMVNYLKVLAYSYFLGVTKLYSSYMIDFLISYYHFTLYA